MIRFNLPAKTHPHYEIIKLNNHVFELRNSFIDYLSLDNDKYISHPSHCVINIEPVVFDEPIYLFGGKVKSASANKITLSKALIHKNDTSVYEKGESLFEVYISDEAITEALLDTGISSAPCTIASVMGNKQEFESLKTQKTSRERVSVEVKEDLDQAKEYFEELKELLEKPINKGTFGKKDEEKLKRAFNYIIKTLPNNINDSLETLDIEYKKDLTTVELEMTSTISKLLEVQRFGGQPILLDTNKNDKDNFLQWFVDGAFSKLDYIELGKLYQSLYDSPNVSRKVKEVAGENIKLMNKVHRERLSSQTNGTFEIKKVMGDFKSFDESDQRKKMVQLSFGQGEFDNRANSSCQTTRKFATVTLSMEKLMKMVRGNASQKLIPCTLVELAKVQIPFKKVFTSKEEIFKNEKTKVNYFLSKDLIELSEKIQAAVKPRLKKEERQVLEDLLLEFDQVFKDRILSLTGEVYNSFDEVEGSFKEQMIETMKVASKGLPNELQERLLLIMK